MDDIQDKHVSAPIQKVHHAKMERVLPESWWRLFCPVCDLGSIVITEAEAETQACQLYGQRFHLREIPR